MVLVSFYCAGTRIFGVYRKILGFSIKGLNDKIHLWTLNLRLSADICRIVVTTLSAT